MAKSQPSDNILVGEFQDKIRERDAVYRRQVFGRTDGPNDGDSERAAKMRTRMMMMMMMTET
jgi:hypothetical protein